MGYGYTYKTSSIYIDARNTKAAEFFRSQGVELTPGEVLHYLCCPSCDGGPIAGFDILCVGEPYKRMSGSEFHRFLRDNNLLLSQQEGEE